MVHQASYSLVHCSNGILSAPIQVIPEHPVRPEYRPAGWPRPRPRWTRLVLDR
jgi:hypothetical protein